MAMKTLTNRMILVANAGRTVTGQVKAMDRRFPAFLSYCPCPEGRAEHERLDRDHRISRDAAATRAGRLGSPGASRLLGLAPRQAGWPA